MWLGHVLRMEDPRIPLQAIRWLRENAGMAKKNQMDIIR